MKRKRRPIETLSLSFLDSISCGLGAVILLLVITKIFEPIHLDESRNQLEGQVVRYEAELDDTLARTETVETELDETLDEVETQDLQIARLRAELARIRGALESQREDAGIETELAGRLAQAKQSLTEEMERLLANYEPPVEDYKIGGIPVDSEYVIFIVDTSSSMLTYAWDRVQQQIRETLDVYPTVKGIQVLNDEGAYMFRSYRGEWIPDTPARREAIIDSLGNWKPFSNSSPREGILDAIETFYDPNKKVSLYVYSDDFAQGSINAVVREVDRANRANAESGRRVRIHAVAFPVYWEAFGELRSASDFAILMRVLCQRNGGTFVALPSRRDM